ncbi:glycine cleavage system aminomethyltransferase GcvT [Marinicella sp. W31]|uniref:glycine cleavage system aminomethyltransferase GcvT n=1 Tax=Marinicella sp. W31 TaxID=3023713 RepID=UPI003757C4FE
MQKTVLHAAHLRAGAKMVDFGGWHMPINYGSQLEEHHAVRQNCGMFDVSHMTVIDLEGPDATAFLLRLLANDVRKLKDAQALYSTMLNPKGGIIDDLIVYRITENSYRVVVNAATRDKDIAWFEQVIKDFDCDMQERSDMAMIAVQGPQAVEVCDALLPLQLKELKRFTAAQHNNLFVGRTGYTGEDGVEIIIPETQAEALWNDLVDAGVQPCGLGARDTLRLEAGMHLYGQDMNDDISPLECGLTWTVRKEDLDFIGADALEDQRATGISKKHIGLVLEDKGVLRHDQELQDDVGNAGIITSGGYSPTSEKAIAMAIVDHAMNDTIHVKIRNKLLSCRVVKMPFVRNGKSHID